jgi:hypothetical protein
MDAHQGLLVDLEMLDHELPKGLTIDE